MGLIAAILIFFFLISALVNVAVDLMVFVINIFLIYAFGLRSFKEVKSGKHHVYVVCGLLSLFILLLTGNFVKYFWPFTTFLLMTCLFVWLFDRVKNKL